MTDTTDIKALRCQAETAIVCGGMFAISGEQALSLLDQFEAERQLAEKLRMLRDSWRESAYTNTHRAEKAEAELAALKGDQVPVAVIQFSKHRKLPDGSKPDWNEMPKVVSCNWLPDGTYNVYLHPQKPVVLPIVPHDFVLRTGGKQIHFGVNARTGEGLWHSRYDGSGMWCGSWYDRTLQELESECISTLAAIKAAIEAAGGKVQS